MRRRYPHHSAYNDGRWPKTRDGYAAAHPNCECTGCESKRCCRGRSPMRIVHHLVEILDVELGLAPMPAGGIHARSNLNSRCDPCHGADTKRAKKARAIGLAKRAKEQR